MKTIFFKTKTAWQLSNSKKGKKKKKGFKKYKKAR